MSSVGCDRRLSFVNELEIPCDLKLLMMENHDKVMELYNVQRFNRQAMPLPTPPRSEDEVKEDCLIPIPFRAQRLPSNFQRPLIGGGGMGYSSSDSLEQHPSYRAHGHHHLRHYYDSVGLTSTPKLSSISGAKTETSSMDASVRTSSSPEEVDRSGELSASVSNASDLEREWVEEDEPGVYITIRELPGGIRELRRVRFSCSPTRRHPAETVAAPVRSTRAQTSQTRLLVDASNGSRSFHRNVWLRARLDVRKRAADPPDSSPPTECLLDRGLFSA
ncbi:hypothetical protein BHM03_00047039 [Ensete ventricosum]|nr:hypothetical protein BHM03_00047039 [Ensete ventricosum]